MNASASDKMSSGASSLIVPLHSAVTFEPVGLVTNVFFDDRNCQVHGRVFSLYYPILSHLYYRVIYCRVKWDGVSTRNDRRHNQILIIRQVFSVRSGGATGIISRGFLDEHNSTFRLADQGPICTIKLSPDQKVLAVQRNKTDVQFIGVNQLGSNGIFDSRKENIHAVFL